MNARSLSRAVVGAAVLSAAIAVGASGSGGRFVEPDVQVLHQFDGAGPNASAYFGWAVSELGDVDRDHVADAIVGEAFSGPDAATGATYVYSGRTGRLIYRFDGAAGDSTGFSVADAGDTDRDHVHDILVGSPGNGPGPRRPLLGPHGLAAPPVHGRGRTATTSAGAVSSAGDVDRDHRADVLVGASQPGGVGPGYATIYSGRTYAPIRTIAGGATGDQLGSGAGWTKDVNHDHVPDQILGARRAGPRTPRRGLRLLGQDGRTAAHDAGGGDRRDVRVVLRRGPR